MKDDLARYCRENGRVCPMPDHWAALWEILQSRTRAGLRLPALPLILGGWHAPHGMKMERLKEHIDWADKHGLLDDVDKFLRSLPESEWAHTGSLKQLRRQRPPMTLDDFRQSLTAAEPPAELTLALLGLWWDAKGDWNRAHESAQQDEGSEGWWVHAYLHRKEGDQSNAAYWYNRAGKSVCQESLDGEWLSIVRALLGNA